MNFFVEGLQGSGKSTLVDRLSRKFPDCRAFREGDYSPVELSWCAYMTMPQYGAALDRYPELREEIRRKSFSEGRRMIVCYTQVKTDRHEFYRDMEQYEIYNNRVSREDFRKIILSRYSRWHGDGMIFECALFQNIVEDMILFQTASDEEIMDFYREVRRALAGQDYQILYLQSSSVESSISAIRKERVDGQGNEVWFGMMCSFFNESPYAAAHGLSGEQDLYEHFRHRQALELRIGREIFPDRFAVLKSREYGDLNGIG